jgi:N-acetylneuraminate synthase
MSFIESEMPFIIAEMSGNHNQSLERALKIVDLAAESGVDAIKLQTYTPDTLTLDIDDGDFYIKDDKNIWKGTSLYKLYSKAYTPWDWHKDIFRRAYEKGIKCFSTPFDSTAIEFLEKLDCPCYKIASFENNDLILIKEAAMTGKPLIVSTGMASLSDIDRLLDTANKNGCKDVTLLKCTSNYPATPEGSNLMTIPHMKSTFGTRVGLSDHTLGIGVALASIAVGGSVIEKHFTDSRASGGVDSTFSMEPAEMRQLVDESRSVWLAMGEVTYEPTEQENDSIKYRRSLYFAKDMIEGQVITEDDIKSIRPGYGLRTEYRDIILGRKVTKNIKRGTPVGWDLV